MWRELFYFSKADKRVILLLCTLILLGAGASFWLSKREADVRPASREELADVQRFLDSLQYKPQNRFSKNDGERYAYGNQSFASSTSSSYALFPFNPNTADSAALLRLGLKSWQVKNIYKYREKGGRYRSPDDFSKLYGLSSADFARLKPYIVLDEAVKSSAIAENKQPAEHKDVTSRDTVRKYPEKFREPTKVDINTADTALLKKIPGIGGGLASAIVGYRARLGGFASLAQLQEIKNLPPNIESWFELGHTSVRRINLNKLSVEQLRKHPYLNFYQAKAIVEHRQRHGALTSLKQLAFYDCFTDADFARLSPYVSF